MKIYHGTSSKHLDSIMNNGLLFKRENSNWEHTFKSIDNMIYLSNCYAPYFARAACKDNEDLIIVETSLYDLNVKKLYPDEDFVAQGISREFGSLEDAHKHVIKHFKKYQGYALDSLEKFGNIAYKGTIKKISRICVIPSDCKFMCAVDPTITIMNHYIMGKYYENVTKWIFGDIKQFPSQFPEEINNSLPKEQLDIMKKRDILFNEERMKVKILNKGKEF